MKKINFKIAIIICLTIITGMTLSSLYESISIQKDATELTQKVTQLKNNNTELIKRSEKGEQPLQEEVIFQENLLKQYCTENDTIQNRHKKNKEKIKHTKQLTFLLIVMTVGYFILLLTIPNKIK